MMKSRNGIEPVESIYWAFSLKCNNLCSHCYNNSGPEMPVLSKEAAMKAVDNFPARLKSRVILSGGEPLHPENRDILYAILEAMRERYGLKLALWVQTNGDYLDAPVLDKLLELTVERIDVSSIDNFHPDNRWKNKDEKVRELEGLFQSRSMKQFRFPVSMATRRNIFIGKHLEKAAKSLGLMGHYTYYSFWGATEDLWLKGNWPRGRAVEKGLARSDPEWNYCHIWSGAEDFLNSGDPRQEIVVQGTKVYPCCPTTRIPLGDLSEANMDDILANSRQIPAFRAVNRGKPENMGIMDGISIEYALERIRELGSRCKWCEEYFREHYKP